MTREEAKKFYPILQAFAEGKVIQVNYKTGGWEDCAEPLFNGKPRSYRIKPEPKYRPFNNADECWQEMQKHHPFGWVKDRNGSKFVIENVDSRGFVEVYDEGTCNFNDVFEFCTFADGTPYGIKEEK